MYSKIIFSISIIFIFQITLFSQSYEFKYFNEEYKPIDSTQSTILFKSIEWDEEYNYVPMGFDFMVEDSYNDSLLILNEGLINFFQTCGTNQFGEIYPPILYAYFSDFDDRGGWIGDGETPLSTIHYLTEGIEGNRVNEKSFLLCVKQ